MSALLSIIHYYLRELESLPAKTGIIVLGSPECNMNIQTHYCLYIYFIHQLTNIFHGIEYMRFDFIPVWINQLINKFGFKSNQMLHQLEYDKV